MKNNKPKYFLLDFEEFSKKSASEEENLKSNFYSDLFNRNIRRLCINLLFYFIITTK
ncbi:MAG: hypothetical protein K0R06_3344 [Clostridium sp.]|jgi:hypothetical protein|nr:hypothetical protein [Clostridium sp.]